MIIKIILAIINPRKWRIMYEQLLLFAKNIIKYRNLSLNLNSKRYWNEKLSKYDGFWRNEHYYPILELLPKDKAFSLLDIGCAIGDGCELLQEKFPKAKIIGVDISKVGIEKAKQKTKNVEYFVLDILRDPIPQRYDYITIIETLEHFDDPFFVIDKCLKHVRESIIISVPCDTFSGRVTGIVDEHRYTFNEKTFASYNCRVVRVTHYRNSKCIVYEIRPKTPKKKTLEQ